ncbi:acriflavin resistance protein [Endozoicomonas sp. (ex Bugula neritina AB1)]|nr:acriflavin resistance protein [Endozoicomonas sp. (ex Bugula neritina AB1)]
MLFVLILITGAASYITIPRESMPDIKIPIIYVSVSYEGISPEDSERLLVMPLENELRSLEGVKEMKATASQSLATVSLEFIAGLDGDQMLAKVRDKVDQARSKLPDGTDEPVIEQISIAREMPVITVVLSGTLTERALVKLAHNLKDELEGFRQVLEVDIAGDREDVVDVIIDPLKLESYGLVPADVVNLVSNNNQLVAAGNLDNGNGRFSVKVPAIYKTPADILSQPIKSSEDRVITFADVADVLLTFKDGGGYARMNGHSSVALEIKKRPGENIVETVLLVKAVVNEGIKLAPDNLKVDFVGDQSEEILIMVNDLQNSVLAAIILVITVVLGALGIRSALLVGISIPGSFLAGILIIAMMGLTINMVVLFSLMMAVGMLVDGAIVVTEYADRKMSEGTNRQEAYKEASLRMAWPIIASTATTLAAFFPLMFWPGMMGEMMVYLPLTLIATLSASLVMALVFIPTIGSLIGKPRLLSAIEQQALIEADIGDLNKVPGVIGRYIKTLSFALQHPMKMLGLGIALVAVIYVMFGSYGKGSEFFPDVDTDNIVVRVKVNSSNFSIDEKDSILKQIEAPLLELPELESLYTRTGQNEEIGTIRVTLVDWQYRSRAAVIAERIDGQLSAFKGLDISVERQKDGPPQGKPLELVISAESLEELHKTVARVKGKINEYDKFIHITDDGPTPGYEWRMEVDRADATRYGASVSTTGALVRLVTSGLTVGSYRPDDSDDEVDIRIRFPENDRHLDNIDQLRLMTQAGLVPVSNYSERVIAPKVDSIRHLNGRRTMTISADLVEGALLNTELPLLQAALQEMNFPESISFNYKGENEKQQESSNFLKNAFSIALFVMAMILVTQFNSFYQALLIMSAVILSTGGVFLGLLVTGQPFGIVMCGIGVISLAGIVVNNNIVLIDTYNVLRRQGMKAEEAVLRTGAQRLRPVILTTVTTILGLMPMVLSTNIDLFQHKMEVGGPTAQWWSQLATAIAGGLAFATVLTLILTPCLLVLSGRRQDRKAANV